MHSDSSMTASDSPILLPPDSPAQTSAPPGIKPASTANNPTCGLIAFASSTNSDRNSSSSKTSPTFAIADWIPCCGASLRSAMTRNGIVYPLAPLTHRTKGIASGSFPTPRCSHATVGALRSRETIIRAGGHKSRLEDFVVMHLPLDDPYFRNLANNIRGRLNPEFIEYLMDFPMSWTDLNVSGTHLSLASRK